MGLFLGPIISGAVAQRTSWRWFFWACTIAQAINLVCLLIMSPETRRVGMEPHSSQDAPAFESPSDSGDAEKNEYKEQIESYSAPINITPECLGHGKPIRDQFGIFHPIDRQALRQILQYFIIPVEIFFFPIIFWAAMSMGAAANALLCVNLLQSQALSAPPYNFSPQNVGFANFALVAGGIAGLSIAGPWSDWVAMRATKKNGGIREPEMRLPSLIPFIAATVVGMVVSSLHEGGSPINSVLTSC